MDPLGDLAQSSALKRFAVKPPCQDFVTTRVPGVLRTRSAHKMQPIVTRDFNERKKIAAELAAYERFGRHMPWMSDARPRWHSVNFDGVTFVTRRSETRPLYSKNSHRCLFVPRRPLSWPLAFPSALRLVDHGRATLSSLPHRFIPRIRPGIDTPSMAPSSLEFRDLLLRVLDLLGLPQPIH